jgi:hypothetical protein
MNVSTGLYIDISFKFLKKLSSNICDYALDDRYGYLTLSKKILTNGGDHRLIVTSKGRHFLLRLGMLREFSRDNEKWINPGVAFIVGVIVSVITVILYLLSRP